jgi:IPT/TIG domain-containing protein
MNARSLLLLSAALLALLAPVATADAATARTTYPSISKIDPLNLAIGETMTITGRGFVKGKNRNTVVFKRDGQRAIFAKAASATSTKLKVVVPDKVLPFLSKKSGVDVPTKFRLRILARRFGKRYTPLSSSPVIAPLSARASTPAPVGDPVPVAPLGPPPDCDADGQGDDVDLDDDNDHMSDAFEAIIGTATCNADTDGDHLSDYWEYQSALDLNLRALPYPGKRPYPNPLFKDADVDYDGDGMMAWQEHAMWTRYAAGGPDIFYSDGKQMTDPASGLTDDDRDVDGDGLANWWEANGPGLREWWKAVYASEVPYAIEYADLDFLDADTDGDGRLDGVDDVDHDGYTNIQEMYRDRGVLLPDKYDASVAPRYGWVQPFNPCLPDPEAITCTLHPPAPVSSSWPPFKELGLGIKGFVNDVYPRPLPWPAPPALDDPSAP